MPTSSVLDHMYTYIYVLYSKNDIKPQCCILNQEYIHRITYYNVLEMQPEHTLDTLKEVCLDK